SFTEEQQREGAIEYNYRREPAWQLRSDEGMASRMPGTPVGDNAAMTGTDPATYTRERPGMSAFVLEDSVVYHTYSTYARGLDGLWGMHQWLDRAPKGRNETDVWWRRHDEYDKGVRKSTRLNSSHVSISYAVFCLKKKKHSRRRNRLPSQRLRLRIIARHRCPCEPSDVS